MSNYLKWKKYENFIDWDIPNWSRAIQYLDKYKLTEFYGKKVLEIGSGFGCLSFWAASNGAKVICLDIVASSEVTINMVKKYKIKKNIKFEKLNILEMPQRDEFDFVLFKSVLVGIIRSNNRSDCKRIMYGIYDMLKPKGECLFIENVNGTFLHQYLRKKYGIGKNMWYYSSLEDFTELSKPFKLVKYRTFGFLGCGEFYLKKLDLKWIFILKKLYRKPGIIFMLEFIENDDFV